MKKTLFLTSDFPPLPGGQSTYYYNLWRRLPPDKVVVVGPKTAGCGEFDRRGKFRVYRRGFLLMEDFWGKLLKSLLLLFFALKVVRKERPGAIHCGQALSSGIVGLVLSKLFRLPYVVYTWGRDIGVYSRIPFMNRFLRLVLRGAKLVISGSEFVKRDVIERGADPVSVVAILPGVDVQLFRPDVDTSALERCYSLKGKKVILSVNRLVERKGNDTVIKAMPEVLKRVPNAVYLIAGAGPYMNKLRKAAKSLNVTKNVIFAGNVGHDKLAPYYNVCDVFVMISRELEEKGSVEGFGIVFLEAGACGKPVVGGRSGGVTEAIVDGETGVVIDSRDADLLAETLIELLTDESRARELGERGRLRSVKDFSWNVRAEQLHELLNEV